MPRSARFRINTLVGAGNGIRCNPRLRSIIEGYFKMPLKTPLSREEAAIGAALSAAVGSGQIKNYFEVGEMIR